MLLIRSKASLIQPQGYDVLSIKKLVESAGRTCYKSEDKITDDSAETFVQNMIDRGHTAMLEAGPVYLKCYGSSEALRKYRSNKFSTYDSVYEGKEVFEDGNDVDIDYYHTEYVTTNLRVMLENNWLTDLQYVCEPDPEHHSLRISMRFITDRGVSHELVRHRAFSFAQESARFCDYNKTKFGKQITYIIPSWLPELPEGHVDYQNDYPVVITENGIHKCSELEAVFINQLQSAEDCYMDLVTKWEERKPDRRYRTGYKGNPLTPQQARQVLPNALKTEIVLSAFTSDWKHFFDLRYYGTTGSPHPDMLELSTKAVEVLKANNLWDICHNEPQQ
jgi:thymidylate synthase (FAD)